MSSALHIRKRGVRPDPLQSRAPRLAARRRRARILGAGLVLLCSIGLALGVSLISRLERLTIREVSVSGTRALSSRSVAAAAQVILSDGKFHLLSRENIFLYPSSSVEKTLSGLFPRIETVSVSRENVFSQTLLVTLSERNAFGQWCAEGGACFLMDDGGFVFAPAASDELTETGYVFEGALAATESPVGQTLLRGRFVGVLDLLRHLHDAGFSPGKISIENDQDISITCAEGYRILVSFGSDATILVQNLELVMSSDALRGQVETLEYVDLRFGDRVYYKLRKEKAAY